MNQIIEDILKQQNKSEKLAFQRSLARMMYEDYWLTDDIRASVDAGTYIFPSCNHLQNDKSIIHRILTRKQDYFSIKIHYIDTDTYFHKHDFLELLYVYRGSCTHYTGDLEHKIVLHENEMIWVNQNMVHAIGKISSEDVILKMVLPAAYLRNEFCYKNLNDKLITNFFTASLQEKNHYSGYIVFRNKKPSRVKEYMEQILQEYFEQKVFYEHAIKHLLNLMLIELVRNELKEEAAFIQMDHNWIPIEEILYEIQEHPEKISLIQLAEKYGYNVSYLSRMIREETGKSYRQLLAESRYCYAKKLMQQTEMTMSMIAEKCGYQNAASLYRFIKKNR